MLGWEEPFGFNHDGNIDLAERSIKLDNIWLDGIMGVIVGDALGNPVQFMAREDIRSRCKGLVTGMESGGVYDTPIGTWTDDGSMTLATLDSIRVLGDLDPEDVMTAFVDWYEDGEYTPFGEAFDEGNTCSNAIVKYEQEKDIASCGGTSEHCNGNGSLMRILPACLYEALQQKKNGLSDADVIRKLDAVSGLTHNHLRSKIACGLYYFMVRELLETRSFDKKDAVIGILQKGIDTGVAFYAGENDPYTAEQLAYYTRLFNVNNFGDVPEVEIKSSGYVVDTLEAAVWCLITTDSFKDCMLRAVNLGDDADTVGAVCGGLGGLYYGYDQIPEEWIAVIQRREWMEDICREVGNRDGNI